MGFTYDPVLYTGRPAEKRSPVEEACYDLLDKLEIPFFRVDHSPADTIEECRVIEDLLQVGVTKNLFLRNRARTSWFLLTMPGDKPFHTRDVIRQLGIQRLSFGEAEPMQEMLGVHPGSVSLLGLMNDTKRQVRYLIDEEIVSHEFIRCHPCINTSTLKIRTDDVMKKLLPYIGHYPTLVRLPEE